MRMNSYLLIFLGGGIGSVSRYFLSNVFSSIVGVYSIALVNIFGSFLMGILYSIVSQKYNYLNYFLLIGLLGGFTTFSTFSIDILNLISQSSNLAIKYLVLSVGGSLFAAYAGIYLVSRWRNLWLNWLND